MTRALLISLLLLFASCSDDNKLTEIEAATINTVFKEGVAFERDAYVRAETLRVIEILADPALSSYATKGLDDTVPMVRLAALRATLAAKAPDATTAAARVFARGSNDEKHVVLNAVAEYDEGPSRRELLGRALRSTDPRLRQLAFRNNVLTRVDKAAEAKDEKALTNNLYPELGRYVGLDKDPVLASLAVRKFLDLGQTERIEPLIEELANDDAKLERRLRAAKILVGAKAAEAEPTFRALINRRAEVMNDDTLGIPDEIVPPALYRMAVLGAVAGGATDQVKKAQTYMNNVAEEDAIEVLEALGGNPSAEAAVTLKVAMQDSRRRVRLRAIDIYQERKDADANALISAVKGADYETQKRLARVLNQRFQKEWVKELEKQLYRTSELERTLELLRDVVTNPEEAKGLVVPLKPVLAKIQNSEEGRRAALASYLLAITSTDEAEVAAEKLGPATRYAYLEYLVRTNPEAHVPTFRKYLYDDLFVVRLMCSAGLWRVLGSTAQSSADAKSEAKPETTPDAG